MCERVKKFKKRIVRQKIVLCHRMSTQGENEREKKIKIIPAASAPDVAQF